LKVKIIIEEYIHMKLTVNVWDKQQEIDVYQKSKSVWIAVGEYMGERLDVKGTTESQAANNWREAARYKGN
jgi:hypothetical protein